MSRLIKHYSQQGGVYCGQLVTHNFAPPSTITVAVSTDVLHEATRNAAAAIRYAPHGCCRLLRLRSSSHYSLLAVGTHCWLVLVTCLSTLLILPLYIDAHWFLNRQHCTQRYLATDRRYYLTPSIAISSIFSSRARHKHIIKGWVSCQPPASHSIGFVSGR